MEKLRDELHEKWSANHQLPSASSAQETAESSYEYEDGEDPASQLLVQYWTHHQYDSSLQVPADNTYTLPPASSSLQILAADNVYAPPSYQEINQCDSSVQIPAEDSVYAPSISTANANKWIHHSAATVERRIAST